MPEFCCKKEEGSEVTRFGFRCTVYILGQSNHSVCCLFCYAGLNCFIGCFCKAKCAIDLISAQTSEEGIKCKVLSLLEACFDLISSFSPCMKIQNLGRKITENLEFESQLWAVKFFCTFIVHFQILHKKLHIFVFNHF